MFNYDWEVDRNSCQIHNCFWLDRLMAGLELILQDRRQMPLESNLLESIYQVIHPIDYATYILCMYMYTLDEAINDTFIYAISNRYLYFL